MYIVFADVESGRSRLRPQSPRKAEDRGVVMAWSVGYGIAGGALTLRDGGGGTGAGIAINREFRRRCAAGESLLVDIFELARTFEWD